jgi:two-component system cell cycle sensor histidine kinase/response regulator CckA
MTFVTGAHPDEETRTEAERLRVRRLEALGRLSAGVAHDANNLLTAIQGYGEIVTSRLEPGDPVRADVEEMTRAAGRAAVLMRQLLTFGRGADPRREPLDLGQLVRGIERLLRRSLGGSTRLRLALERGALEVEADPGQLEQVVLNLVLNARDALPQGGEVVIQTAALELAEARTLGSARLPAGRYARLSVLDAGAGMPPEVLARAFEPFFTTKDRSRGTGLGLPTASAIVEQFGGTIVLTSEPGAGTAANVYLPRRGTLRGTRT